MPKLSDPAAAELINMLMIGDGGSGKTGALASLVRWGFNLGIADYDNGVPILRNLLTRYAREDGVDPKVYLDRVDFEVCRDPVRLQGMVPVPTDSVGWSKGIRFLQKFMESAGPNEIAVMDSLSFAAKMAMTYVLKINNRLVARPYEADWGVAQGHVERLAELMTSDVKKCHVLATAHIAYTGGKEKVTVKNADGSNRTEIIDNGPERGFPAMIGKAINPVIGRYFNHTALVRQVGAGNANNRRIHTNTFDTIELKNTNPGVIKSDYPLATGLAEYFRDAGVTPKGPYKWQPQTSQASSTRAPTKSNGQSPSTTGPTTEPSGPTSSSSPETKKPQESSTTSS